MPEFAWVQNQSGVEQHWGAYHVTPGALGLVPVEYVTGQLPAGVRIVSNDSERWIFRRTDHAPGNPRYQR